MTDFNKHVEFQLSCQWTDVTALLIVWFVISIVLKEKKVKKNNRVDTIIQEIRVRMCAIAYGCLICIYANETKPILEFNFACGVCETARFNWLELKYIGWE